MISQYQATFTTDEFTKQVQEYLFGFGQPRTFHHVLAVARQAATLAEVFGEDASAAYRAGLLHDISVVIPNEQRLSFQKDCGGPVYDAEKQLPMLLHQRQSRVLASEVFAVKDTAILAAVECHTTLKPGATRFDQLLFIADKIRWDRPGEPPYLSELIAVLKGAGLTAACRVYIAWLLQNDLLVLHPWLAEAAADLQVSF